MPRLTYLAGVALILVDGALALTHELLGPWPGVNERNVRRIKDGMTLQEVEAILGGPGVWRTKSGGVHYTATVYEWRGAGSVAIVRVWSRAPDWQERVDYAAFEWATRLSPAPRSRFQLRPQLGW
jgi:hypothetical protein